MKKMFLIITLLLSIMLSGCMSHIEDTNGDDTTLETIDLAAKIEEGSYSARSSLSTSIYSGGVTYCFNYEDIDFDFVDLTYDKISGTTKVHCSDMIEGEELVLTISSTVESGNLEIAVVGPDKELIEMVTVNTTVTVTIPSTVKGEYFVVIGAESAEISITIDREIK